MLPADDGDNAMFSGAALSGRILKIPWFYGLTPPWAVLR
jgi:hypothetical protein